MSNWSNWSGRQQCDAADLHFARSVEDVAAVVAAAAGNGQRLRVVGSGHSHYPLVPTAGLILDVGGLSGVIDASAAERTARVRAGTPIYALGRALHDAGLALHNQGDIDRQTIAGAVATGTHGTGLRLKNLAAAVRALTLVLGSGEVVVCSAAERPDLFEIARLNLGAIGVVVDLTLGLRDAYRLAEYGWTSSYDELADEIATLPDRHRHFEFFWYPYRDRVIAKTIDETGEPAVYPLATEGERRAWSYEVLPNHRPLKHTEMEFSVPLARGPECLAEIRELIRHEFPELRWPVEYRTVAADDVWLSTAFERDVATISVHQGIDQDDEPLFRACEAVFRRHDGRPHWGKVHYFDAADLSAAHPRWRDWWGRRDALDPAGTFLNPTLESLRPAA